MSIRVAVNGFGRIGRLVLRVMAERDEFQVVAINDLTSAASLAQLLKYDSVHGRFPGTVELDGEDTLVVNGNPIAVSGEKDVAKLPWAKHQVDFAVESTGVFRHREQIAMHLEAGASKVLLTVPPKDEIDALIVLGVNDDDLEPGHQIISNASCTTNCLAPAAKVLHEKFGIERGLMTTIHAYTNGQRILDSIHKDLRRARSAAANIIPTTTGAARAVGKVIPDLAGKLDGMAMRVPVQDGSVVDLCCILNTDTSLAEVLGALREAADGPLSGILSVTDDPIVSQDIVGDSHSSIVDAGACMMSGSRFFKLITWYDNEWGYSSRVVDLMAKAMSL
ncbi:MAG: type I glyceraldehyde-3-phosphate dehydrogenase [Planctomycetota bacterium]